jgi:hypothetical protein
MEYKVTVLSEPKTIISNPHGRHNYFGWPSIARLQSGALAVVCSGYRCGHVCPFGKLVMAMSFDQGETYTGAFPLIDTPLDDRDGGICVFGDAGVIVTSFNNTVEAQRRWNPVFAELEPRYILRNEYYQAYLNTVTKKEEETYLGAQFRLSADGGRTFGPIFRSPVTSPHGPSVLSDGTLLWVGRIFSEDDTYDENSGVHAYRVNPDGTMDFLGAVPNVYENGKRVYLCEPHSLELPDGRILCHIRSEGAVDFGTYQTESTDGGRTWSPPEQILPAHGGAPCHLLLHSSGTLISAYGYREEPYGVRVMLSGDLGRTWQKDIPLFEGVSSDLGYPCTAELPDGSLLTVFYAKDAEPGPAVIKQIRWRL